MLPTGRPRSRRWPGPGGRPPLPSPSAPRPQSSTAPGRRRRRAGSRYCVIGGANGRRDPCVSQADALEGPPPARRGCQRPAAKPDSDGPCRAWAPAPMAPPLIPTSSIHSLAGGSSHPQGQAAPDPAPVTLSCPSGHPGWGRREATPGQVTPWPLSPAGAAGSRRLLRTLLAAVASPCESITFRPPAPFTAVCRLRAAWRLLLRPSSLSPACIEGPSAGGRGRGCPCGQAALKRARPRGRALLACVHVQEATELKPRLPLSRSLPALHLPGGGGSRSAPPWTPHSASLSPSLGPGDRCPPAAPPAGQVRVFSLPTPAQGAPCRQSRGPLPAAVPGPRVNAWCRWSLMKLDPDVGISYSFRVP